MYRFDADAFLANIQALDQPGNQPASNTLDPIDFLDSIRLASQIANFEDSNRRFSVGLADLPLEIEMRTDAD